MFVFKRKSNIEQPPQNGEPKKNVSERLEDALRNEGNSSDISREAWLNYVKETDGKIDHHDHEIRRLKIKKDINEIGESSHKGFYRECTMTIRFFKHLYEFVIGEGLAPEKVQKYVSSAKKGLIVLGVVALASIGSSIYSCNAMRRTLEQNRDLLNLSQTTKDNTSRLQEVSNSFSNNYVELSKNYTNMFSEIVKLKADLVQKTSEMQKYASNLSESESSNRQFQIALISSNFSTNVNNLADAISDLRKQHISNAENIEYNSNQISNLLMGVCRVSENYGSLDSRLLGLEKRDYGPRMKALEEKGEEYNKRINVQDKKIEQQDKRIEHLRRTE
jgi:hypothetical protein